MSPLPRGTTSPTLSASVVPLYPCLLAEGQVRAAQRAANEAAGTLAGTPPQGAGEATGPFGLGERRAPREPDPRVGQYRGAKLPPAVQILLREQRRAHPSLSRRCRCMHLTHAEILPCAEKRQAA